MKILHLSILSILIIFVSGCASNSSVLAPKKFKTPPKPMEEGAKVYDHTKYGTPKKVIAILFVEEVESEEESDGSSQKILGGIYQSSDRPCYLITEKAEYDNSGCNPSAEISEDYVQWAEHRLDDILIDYEIVEKDNHAIIMWSDQDSDGSDQLAHLVKEDGMWKADHYDWGEEIDPSFECFTDCSDAVEEMYKEVFHKYF